MIILDDANLDTKTLIFELMILAMLFLTPLEKSNGLDVEI